jgi:hypothetical protein
MIRKGRVGAYADVRGTPALHVQTKCRLKDEISALSFVTAYWLARFGEVL